MEKVQSVVEKVLSDLDEGRSEEEVLQGLAPVIEEDPERSEAIIEALGKITHPHIARVLQRLSERVKEKKIRKTIKRTLYRLKLKGISVEEGLPKSESPVFRPPRADPPKGFGGPFDFLGQRFLMLVIPHPGRGLTVMQGIISDTKGLIDVYGGEISRKRFKKLFAEVQQGSPFPLIEMEPSYVGFLLVQAYQRSLDIGKKISQDYLQLKKEVESIKKEYERSPVYFFFPEEDLERDSRWLERGIELLGTKLFTAWRLGEEEIRPFAEEVKEAEVSKLILNQAQKEARLQEIYQRALSNLFPEERRSLFSRRMEEMAYYLYRSGKMEEAKASLAVAIDLKKPANSFQPNPFLYHLVMKSIFIYLSKAYAEERREFQLIVKP